jgi:hypothetical protein
MTESERDEWKTQHHIALLTPDPSASGKAIREKEAEDHKKGLLSDYDKRESKILLKRQVNANQYNATWGKTQGKNAPTSSTAEGVGGLAGYQMDLTKKKNLDSIHGWQNDKNVGDKTTSFAYRHKGSGPGMGRSSDWESNPDWIREKVMEPVKFVKENPYKPTRAPFGTQQRGPRYDPIAAGWSKLLPDFNDREPSSNDPRFVSNLKPYSSLYRGRSQYQNAVPLSGAHSYAQRMRDRLQQDGRLPEDAKEGGASKSLEEQQYRNVMGGDYY